MKRILTLLALLAVVAIGTASAQTKSWYFAYDFGQWAIPGQAASTYTFQGRNICYSQAVGLNFFVFNTNAPVYIQDIGTPSNSESVTVSAVTSNPSGCTITVSPAHSHYSFNVRSGSAGLQEAVNTLGSSSGYVQTVFLDTRWYNQAANIGTPSAIIAAVAGNTQVQLVDATTYPFTYYTWNGANYVKSSLGSGGQFYGLKPSSNTVISPPTALTTAGGAAATLNNLGTGGTVAAGAYRAGITYVDALGGESLLSTDSASTAVTTTSGTTSSIQITAPAAATGAVGYRVYITAASGASGSEVFYSPTAAGCTQSAKTWIAACAMNSNSNITALVTSTSLVPTEATAHATAITASSRPLEQFQTEYGPFVDTSTQSAASSYVAAEFAAPTTLFNTLNKHVQICGNIEATAVNTAVPTMSLQVSNARGQSNNTIATFTPGALTGAAYETNFCVDMVTAVIGASATVQAYGQLTEALASSGVPPSSGTVTDKNAGSTVSFADLTKSTLHFQLVSSPTTAGFSAYIVKSLSIKVLN